MKRTLGTLVFVVLACMAAASTVGASGNGQVCRSFKQAGKSYTYETLGSGWTCTSAKAWIVKLSRDHVGTVTKNTPLENGPSGYHCFANPFSRRGRATAGDCIKGTIAFPKSGFAWTGS
jgi:hypothetical protein